MAEQQFPEPTVGALIFNKEGKIFLMKSHKWNNRYVIPGGHIELGETIKQAVKREGKKETKPDIHKLKLIITQEFINEPNFWKKRHFIFFDLLAKQIRPRSSLTKKLRNMFGLLLKKHSKWMLSLIH